MKIGDVIAFPGNGLIFKVLSRILWLFNRWWDRKHWHLAIAWESAESGWWVMEADAKGVQINFKPDEVLNKCKILSFLKKVPGKKKRKQFKDSHLGLSYDAAVYFLTMIQYLVLHFFNRPLPRILDNRFTCWELAEEWCVFNGKPWTTWGRTHKYPIITDALQALGN